MDLDVDSFRRVTNCNVLKSAAVLINWDLYLNARSFAVHVIVEKNNLSIEERKFNHVFSQTRLQVISACDSIDFLFFSHLWKSVMLIILAQSKI